MAVETSVLSDRIVAMIASRRSFELFPPGDLARKDALYLFHESISNIHQGGDRKKHRLVLSKEIAEFTLSCPSCTGCVSRTPCY